MMCVSGGVVFNRNDAKLRRLLILNLMFFVLIFCLFMVQTRPRPDPRVGA
jgi:hypothetical protein